VRAWAHGLPWIVQLVAIMLMTDIAQYWLHRAFHRVPFLWRFHAVHHSARSMDWMAGARMHFVEIIVLRSVTATPALVIGFEESAIQAYMLIVYVYSTIHPRESAGSFGFLEKILVVPRFHTGITASRKRRSTSISRFISVHRSPVRNTPSARRKMAHCLWRRGPSGAARLLEAVALSVSGAS